MGNGTEPLPATAGGLDPTLDTTPKTGMTPLVTAAQLTSAKSCVSKEFAASTKMQCFSATELLPPPPNATKKSGGATFRDESGTDKKEEKSDPAGGATAFVPGEDAKK